MRQEISKGVSGVYKIKCRNNGKVYIGSAVDIWFRWNTHVWDLRRGDHANRHLQRAFNLYGEINFSFEIIEECNSESRLDRETYWISEFQSFRREIGFNIKIVANSMAGTKSTQETKDRIRAGMIRYLKSSAAIAQRTEAASRRHVFINPNGECVEIFNLTKFCKDNGLSNGNMRSLISGSRLSHKGWSIIGARKRVKKAYSYKLKSPDGEIFEGKNIRKFSQEHGLSDSNVCTLLSGKISQLKGWVKC